MAAIYKEVEKDDFSWVYVQADLKTGAQLRVGTIYKLEIFIEDDETGEIYFSIDQYWIKDEERGVILNNKGERMLFESGDDALWYIAKNKSSLIEVVLGKMKTSGFNSLTDEEKVMLKEHNKRVKENSKNNNLKTK